MQPFPTLKYRSVPFLVFLGLIFAPPPQSSVYIMYTWHVAWEQAYTYGPVVTPRRGNALWSAE